MQKFVVFVYFLFSVLLVCSLNEKRVHSHPIEKSSDISSSLLDNYSGPVMVPVSSTVIPIAHLFGRPKKSTQHSDNLQQLPRRSNIYLSPERRARLFERNNRPDIPGRLITKNSKTKDVNNNETH